MKRNKKAEKHKELLRLEEELWNNWQTQRSLGYKPLPKPIPHGYRAVWVLRDDVARRKDADRFQHILDTYGKSVWCRREDFQAWCGLQKRMVDVNPSFRSITPDVYENLPNWEKKFFSERTDFHRWGGFFTKKYVVEIPSYYLVRKISKDYKTHYKVIDEILQQEEAEIEAKLDEEFYDQRRAHWNRARSNRTWKKFYHRSERSRTKQAIRQNVIEAPEGEYYDEVYELSPVKGNRGWW